MTRNELWQRIEELLEHEDVWLLSCDLGHPHLERLMAKYPDRVMNVGICEQAAVGIATGLAKGGKLPLVYGIGNQLVMRACEQIWFAHLNELPIVLIGIGHYNYYGVESGPSHDADAAYPIARRLGCEIYDTAGHPDVFAYVKHLVNETTKTIYIATQ